MSAQRVVVVGGGIAGLATAWHLVRRGQRDVTLVERESSLGAHATGQNAAILRTTIGDPILEQLALHGARFLREPLREPLRESQRDSGAATTAREVGTHRPPHRPALLEARGVVVVSPRAAAWTERARFLDERERRARVPFLARDAGPAFLVEDEGVVDVPALVAVFAGALHDAGARIVLGARVRELRPRAHVVELDDGTSIAADVVVLAAGAWAEPLARAAGSRVRLTPTRRHLIVTAPDARVDARAPVVWSDADGTYVRPEAGGYMACPCDEDVVDPDSFASSPGALEAVRAKVARVFPGLPASPVMRFWAGLRTHARDGRFVVGRDPDVEGLVWAAALGGHGITCASAVGELAADAVIGTRAPSTSPTLDASVVSALDPARAGARVESA